MDDLTVIRTELGGADANYTGPFGPEMTEMHEHSLLRSTLDSKSVVDFSTGPLFLSTLLRLLQLLL